MKRWLRYAIFLYCYVAFIFILCWGVMILERGGEHSLRDGVPATVVGILGPVLLAAEYLRKRARRKTGDHP